MELDPTSPASPSVVELANDLCQFQGTPDLYGLGIRVGIYSHLFTTCISMILTPEKCGHSLTVTIWFHFSLLLGLFYKTTNRELQVLEIVLVLQLLLLLILTSIPHFCLGALQARTGRPSCRLGSSLLTLISCTVLQFGTFCFALWFVFVQEGTAAPAPCPTTPAERTGHVSSIGKAQLTFWLASLAVTFLPSMYFFYALLCTPHPTSPSSTCQPKIFYYLDTILVPLGEARSAPTTNPLPTEPEKPVPGIRPGVWGLIVVLISLLSVTFPIGTEVALRKNGVIGVYGLDSAGQLIPLTIGIGSLLVCIRDIYLSARQGWNQLGNGLSLHSYFETAADTDCRPTIVPGRVVRTVDEDLGG